MALHSIGVIAVIVDDLHRVLLTRRRDNGDWEPPGGGLEHDEDIIAGLRREVLEETGLDIEAVALTGVYKNMDRMVVGLVFQCKPAGGQLTLNDEVTAFRWVTASEVAKFTNAHWTSRIADALLGSHRTAVIRRHDGARLL
jgi:8-oxo-dGTP diphosphatase